MAYLRNWRRLSRSVGSMLPKRTRTPAEALRVTTPLRAKPLTQILPLATHSPISTLAAARIGLAVSTRHPPALVLLRLPHTGVVASSTRSSTATKHLMRGWRRRSSAELGWNTLGSNGGEAEAGVGTGCDSSIVWTLEAGADFRSVAACALISRMVLSRVSSRFAAGASR